MKNQADIAVIGLAVMGQNLIMNMNDHGYRVVAYNRTAKKTEKFLNTAARDTQVQGAATLQELVDSLKHPRKIMLMVKAGPAVDAVIEQLLPLLSDGDIIIDGGNSNFEDSQRRADRLLEANLLFVGSGVSGGEEGARHGPSLMPGGHAEAWPHIAPIFQSIAAKTDQGDPCCEWVGDGGAGHFVKMVHNGIEYGDMQLICESYHFMQEALGMDNTSMANTFAQWNKADLESYLIEITSEILAFRDEDGFVVDRIMDKAGQKGTGKWTGINALELGIPLTLIGEAVFSRALSAIKNERIAASERLQGPETQPVLNADTWLRDLGEALLAAKIVSYAQGYMLMRAAADEYNWQLNYGAIAQMWRGGCIIRSAFLDDIKAAFENNQDLRNLLLDNYFLDQIHKCQVSWRKICAEAMVRGIPMPAMNSALCFYDGYRTKRLPANLLQAQRDYFGAHTYQLLDGDDNWHHTDWIGSGSSVSSTSYDA
ncbi:MAG: decarboxylating NADP(+)-dependent phosphogluconate dehydrogenase [Granulosicoccus sp.]|nr:decarboxylating NADP(+)-dependent phosphogluconate dehydrogenase [Granulosicoccus sp.]